VKLTRREMLEMTGWLAIAAPAAAQTKDAEGPGTRARAAEVIRGYSAEGDHRTATPVDRASADRLLALARATGATVSLAPFELSRVDPIAAFLEIDGQRIDGLPMFDGAFTGADGVSGAIGSVESGRPIAWTKINPNAEAVLRPVRDGSRARAIVAVTTGAKPGLCPVNAAFFSEPFGPPVLQIGSEHLATIERAAAAGREIRLVAHATRQRATAFNLVSDLPGTNRDLAPVCVMTPRSGWYRNASERGGGLVCWLETMRASVAAHGPAKAEAGHDRRGAVVSRPPRTVKFVASSGHELGHLGLRAYLAQNPALAHDALLWVHLGANIGTSTGPVGMSCSDDRAEAAAMRALTVHGLDQGLIHAPAAQVGGEAGTINKEGGRFISFIGRNDWFHNPRDGWPDTVDIAAIARFARAVADLAIALANTPA
jgi:hypothetical protein